MKAISDLAGLYPGETIWIVGKGPSLGNLRAHHFGSGPIITINEAILFVQDFGLANPIYSMQKDGCGILSPHERCIVQPPNFQQMVKPRHDIPVILQEPGYSQFCLADYPHRIMMNLHDDFGLLNSENSIRVCVRIGQLMGCREIVFMCCDSLANGDLGSYDFGVPKHPGNAAFYATAASLVREDVKDIAHKFLTPEKPQ